MSKNNVRKRKDEENPEENHDTTKEEKGRFTLPVFRQLQLAARIKGNLVTDAWIAAAVQASSEHVVTFDRDFVRLLPARDVTILELSPSSRSPNIILQPRSHGLPRKPRHHSRFGRFAINIYK